MIKRLAHFIKDEDLDSFNEDDNNINDKSDSEEEVPYKLDKKYLNKKLKREKIEEEV